MLILCFVHFDTFLSKRELDDALRKFSLSEIGAKSSRLNADSISFSERITETTGVDTEEITGDGSTEPDAVLHAGLRGFADFRSLVVNFGGKTECKVSGSSVVGMHSGSSWRRRRSEEDTLSAPC